MNRPGPQPDPPYIRIVREIRRRIAAGELRAGDRVPSTREITRQWGVAMATATKVLTTLRQEGLVRALPGVGTVVHVPEPSRPAVRRLEGRGGPEGGEGRVGEQDLTRERIVRAGVAIADAEGLAALSMRRIAAELDVATMSLYRHVGGKDELVTLMVDTAFGDSAPPESSPEGWRERLELAARMHWALYRRHPWLAQVMSFTRPLLSRNALVHSEWLMRALDGLGLRPNIVLHTAMTVISYVHGIAVNLEREALAQQETGVTDEEWLEALDPTFAGILASGDFPTFAGIVTHPESDFDLDTLFEFGLERMLDGLAVLIER
ncbi:TetR/AcrR family transcriptional regulator C-terminal domain-containing protein [Sphaerisporangium perillae]|uniref:TetR/AcrR family transcriptional regulator C-terminal domain-containing protein n=1 Tax=Sphaerisporangium perillae TaxID=2935860 RepID=UPI00200F149D|nr:TetR/AcrR family transcriptional regulator C-terminal domain-containing protein [Sphaerisporangium perillae]